MQYKNYLLYIGTFFAGAFLSLVVLGIFNRGDRPKPTTDQSSSNEFAANTDADQAPTSTFEQNDKKEDVLKDYETTSPAALKNLPTTIPQFALNQPAVKPYPNYWANIPQSSFATAPSQAKASNPKSATKFVDPQAKRETLPTSSLSPSFSSAATEFVPPANGQQNNPQSVQFNGDFHTSNDFNLKDFLNSPATNEPTPSTTNDKK